MNYTIKMVLLLLICAILFVGCSSDNGDTNSTQTQTDTTDSNQGEKEEDDKTDTSMEETEEDRFGLKLGETGIVQNVDKMEVTIDSPRFEEEIGGFTSTVEIYLVMDVSIKNIGNTTFDGKEIFTPDVSTDDNNERSAYINPALDEEKDGVKLLDGQGQLKPGDTVNGELIFSTKKAKKYKIAFGHESSQIVTKAAWEFSDSEVK